jgi:spermidine synthase
MNSRTSSSELLLGQVGCARLPRGTAVRLLIGGLGLGFTLKRALEQVGPSARVEAVELFPEVVEWNRRFLGPLNGALLEDPRVEVHVEDVFHTLRRAGPLAYDAILLDIDNGPTAMVQRANFRLYDRRGLQIVAAALKPGGRVAIWSAARDAKFEERLRRTGFQVQLIPAKLYPGARREACTIYVGDLAPQ